MTADDWGSLGHGYAAAEDNLCVLADAFVTFRGERSMHFGADGTQSRVSTIQYPLNIDSDVFFRAIIPIELVDRFRAAQSPQFVELSRGYAAGFSRYAREVRAGGHAGRHRDCRVQAWLTEISDADIYRRLYALSLTAGTLNYITTIANARPGQVPPAGRSDEPPPPLQFGSNAIAFGGRATHTAHGLLLGNPHWVWDGMDRFHQIHLRIPGQLNVQGVSVLGVPIVMLGFNDNVAWTHTVSTAKRFTPYRLTLVAGDPTAYVYDGKVRRLTPNSITVQVRNEDGVLHAVSRTLYRSHFGPMLAGEWTATHAVSLRDVNAEDFHVFGTWFEWNQASSLEDFIRIQKRDLGVTFVNTVERQCATRSARQDSGAREVCPEFANPHGSRPGS